VLFKTTYLFATNMQQECRIVEASKLKYDINTQTNLAKKIYKLLLLALYRPTCRGNSGL